MELASHHPSGTCSFEVAARFLENLWALAWDWWLREGNVTVVSEME
jgi:hypothetical protein